MSMDDILFNLGDRDEIVRRASSVTVEDIAAWLFVKHQTATNDHERQRWEAVKDALIAAIRPDGGRPPIFTRTIGGGPP